MDINNAGFKMLLEKNQLFKCFQEDRNVLITFVRAYGHTGHSAE